MKQRLLLARQHWQHQSSELHQVSPLATLNRGYAVVQNQQGELVRSVQQIQTEALLSIRLSDGQVAAQVLSVSPSVDNQ